jgi:hypothetical protein
METQELTIKVQEVISKSGIELEIDVTELHTLADKASAITSVNDEGFTTVKKELQLKRKEISEGMFQARSEFNRMSKGIIEVEKTLLEIFVPAEQNLIALDKAEKERVLKEERLASLPARKERLAAIGTTEAVVGLHADAVENLDAFLLDFTDADFELYLAGRIAAKADADRLAAEAKLAEERAAFEAEKAELARKQAEADAIEQARKEEQERAEERLRLAKEQAELEKKEIQERAEREKKEAEERRKAEEQERLLRAEREEKERKERIEREAKEKADAELEAKRLAEEAQAKRAADAKWQTFLKTNNYNQETDIVTPGPDGKLKIYRLVAVYE